MTNYLLILPIAFLVACSQLLIKLRSAHVGNIPAANLPERLLNFASDPVILTAYGAALFASFAWLYVVARLPLTIAFPVYIGVTFLMVVVGSSIFLAETLSVQKLLAMVLILAGIALSLTSKA